MTCDSLYGLWNLESEIWWLGDRCHVNLKSEIWLLACHNRGQSGNWNLKIENWSLNATTTHTSKHQNKRRDIVGMVNPIWNLEFHDWDRYRMFFEIWNLKILMTSNRYCHDQFGIWNLKSRWPETVDMVSGIWHLKFDDLETVAMSI